MNSINFDNSYARLPERFFAKLDPKAVKHPELIALNDELAAELNLDPRELRSSAGVAALSGNERLAGSEPLAMAYAGQQFGNWVPQLGDGRALLLGEVLDRKGVRRDIQLKGSGPTPFSRMGDGRAWLGPVMREYIVSEAMAALGVPTTRALAAVSTGEQVIREDILPGAILTRVSLSHVRVGTFQFFAARRDEDGLRALADYTIDRLYPDVAEAEDPYIGLFGKVVERQAQLVAKWMNLGFIHGVMNTDNVSIAGETIDYGPCAFMDDYHADRVFSSIDQHGRYAFCNQPRIAHWNLVQLAQSLLPLFSGQQEEALAAAQATVDRFPQIYTQAHREGFNAKIGLKTIHEGDAELGNDLLSLMAANGADFTLTFRQLGVEDPALFLSHFEDKSAIDRWLKRWRMRLEQEEATDALSLMKSANPAIIPRNHRIEQAIQASLEGDFAPFHRLNDALAEPYRERADYADLTQPPLAKEIVAQTFCGT
ncbi:MAG: protein adenylyltransferase SelO [Rhizobiaceae bacterium]